MDIHRCADLPTFDDIEEEQERAGASRRKETRRPDSKRHITESQSISYPSVTVRPRMLLLFLQP